MRPNVYDGNINQGWYMNITLNKSSHCQKKTLRFKAVILAESQDFGRCRLTSQLPRALWPIVEKTALENLLQGLSWQGAKEAVICSNGDTKLLKKHVDLMDTLKCCFMEMPLPVGTAGCIRDAGKDSKEELLLVLKAETVLLPDLVFLLNDHLASGADMTIVFCQNGSLNDITEDIYICNSDVINFIPKQGYFDIKEELIPAFMRLDHRF
jgi:NDP-sugar pyrophosphorylase family protein